jgi:hypothetical protein
MSTLTLFLALTLHDPLVTCARGAAPRTEGGRVCVSIISQQATDLVLSGEYPTWIAQRGFAPTEQDPETLLQGFLEAAEASVRSLQVEMGQ